MTEKLQLALAFLVDNWGIKILSTSEGAQFLNIKPPTLKTRLHKGVAMALYDVEGRARADVGFTGENLVWTIIADRLLRYNFPADRGEFNVKELASTYTERAHRRLISENYDMDYAPEFALSPEREAIDAAPSDDARVIIPIGRLVAGLAWDLWLQHDLEGRKMLRDWGA